MSKILCHKHVPILCWFFLSSCEENYRWTFLSNGKIRLIYINDMKLQVLSFRQSFWIFKKKRQWFLLCFSFFRQKRWKTKTFKVEVTLEEEEDTFLIQTQVTEQFLKSTSHSWNSSCKNHPRGTPWVWFRAVKIYGHFSVLCRIESCGWRILWDFWGFP